MGCSASKSNLSSIENNIPKTINNENVYDTASIDNNASVNHNDISIKSDESKISIDFDGNSIEYFTFEGTTVYAKCISVYDGDTFTACWLHNNMPIKYRCRCYGYDSPEMKPLKSLPNRDDIKLKAMVAKHQLEKHLMGDKLIRLELGKFDKYGRILVTMYDGIHEKSINDIMIETGYGTPYFGGTKS